MMALSVLPVFYMGCRGRGGSQYVEACWPCSSTLLILCLGEACQLLFVVLILASAYGVEGL